MAGSKLSSSRGSKNSYLLVGVLGARDAVLGTRGVVLIGAMTRRVGSVRGVIPKRRETGPNTVPMPHLRGAGVSGSVTSLMGESAVAVWCWWSTAIGVVIAEASCASTFDDL